MSVIALKLIDLLSYLKGLMILAISAPNLDVKTETIKLKTKTPTAP